jgi:AraC-like DNA-binding protein
VHARCVLGVAQASPEPRGSLAMATTRQRTRDGGLSLRLVLPFLREGQHPLMEEILTSEEVDLRGCLRPEARVSRRVAMRALDAYVGASGDTTIGLRAGLGIEPGDLDVVESTARFCATLREAILSAGRYLRLVSECAVLVLREEGKGNTALACFHTAPGVRLHHAANDFLVASAVTFIRRHADATESPAEIHLTHRGPTDKRSYEREFGARVRFGMPHNGIAVRRSQLDRAMPLANAILRDAFDAHASELLDRSGVGLRGRVADVATDLLRAGTLTMPAVARRLGVSAATLRRHLEGEGTTFREVVDEVKRAIAEHYMLDRTRTISEIGFALGFSNVSAFHRAFRRWKSVSPSEYRRLVSLPR